MDSNSTKLRFAIIGCGGIIATSHIRALKQMPGAQIAAMCDVNPATGGPRAAEEGCPFFTDYHELLEQVKPDVVSICTPHPFHAPIAVAGFAAGAHVLTEKPMSIEVAEA